MMNTSKFSCLAGILVALGLLSNIKPADAITFNFSTTINGLNYSGTLDFASTGTNLAPLLNSNTVLTQYQGNTVNSTAASFVGSPKFDVTASTLTIASNGGLTYSSGQTLGFLSLSSIQDSSNFNSATATFTPVPFEFSPLEGMGLGLPLFIGVRILKKRNALKKSSRELQEITN